MVLTCYDPGWPLRLASDKEVVDPVDISQVSRIEVLPVNADMIRQNQPREIWFVTCDGKHKARVANC